MEEQNVQTQESSKDLLNATVGQNEGSKALECKPVQIKDIVIQTVNKEGKTMDNPLVQLLCKHPDKEDLIKLTQIKRLIGEKLANTALFVSVDDDGQFMKDSGVACLLKFNNKSTLKELEGIMMDTVKESETSKYMALKCY